MDAHWKMITDFIPIEEFHRTELHRLALGRLVSIARCSACLGLWKVSVYSEDTLATASRFAHCSLDSQSLAGFSQSPHPLSQNRSGSARRCPRILVAEDDAQMRRILVSFLKTLVPAGQVTQASEGRAALELVGRQAFDLVVADSLRPGEVDAFEVMRQLRLGQPSVPVIFISGQPGLREEALAAGASCFLSKPFDLDGFLAAVLKFVVF